MTEEMALALLDLEHFGSRPINADMHEQLLRWGYIENEWPEATINYEGVKALRQARREGLV